MNQKIPLKIIKSQTLSLGIVCLLIILFFIGCADNIHPVRTVAYVGRFTNASDTTPIEKQEKNKFDVLHQYVLEQYLSELNQELPNVSLQLKTYDCQRTTRGSDSVYKLIVADTNIISVVDNTWGIHLAAAQARIQAVNLPIIAINADHGGLDFGTGAVFTGNSDEVPEDLATYIDKALNEHTVNFLTEQDYALTNGYYNAFESRGITVNKEFNVTSSKSLSTDSLKKITDEIKLFYKTNPLEKHHLLVVNVHSNWGNKLLRFIDENLDGMRILGHAYIANGNELAGFGKSSTNDIVLITNPTDALSQNVHKDLAHHVKNHPKEFDNVNAPLFIKRCIDAVAIIRNAVLPPAEEPKSGVVASNQSKDLKKLKLSVPSRSSVQERFTALRSNTLAGTQDLYNFDRKGVLIPDLYFSRYSQGKLFSMPQQLNSRRELIPNLLFGMEIQDIYDLNVASNSFTTDFYYWVKMDSSNRSAEKYISFQNMKSSQSTRELVIENTDGGLIYRLYRVSGNFYVNYLLGDFPFDKQELAVNVEILSPDDRMKISFDQSALMLDPKTIEKYKVTGWNKKSYLVTVDNLITRSIKGDPQGKPGTLKKFKNFAFRLEVERIFLGSFLQIILPLILIGLIAISVLFIRDLTFENVGEVSVGIFLSIIAFSISLSNMIPSSNYLTRADTLFWLTFIVVFGSFMIVIVLNSMYDAEHVKDYRLTRLRIALAILYPLLVLYVLFG